MRYKMSGLGCLARLLGDFILIDAQSVDPNVSMVAGSYCGSVLMRLSLMSLQVYEGAWPVILSSVVCKGACP